MFLLDTDCTVDFLVSADGSLASLEYTDIPIDLEYSDNVEEASTRYYSVNIPQTPFAKQEVKETDETHNPDVLVVTLSISQGDANLFVLSPSASRMIPPGESHFMWSCVSANGGQIRISTQDHLYQDGIWRLAVIGYSGQTQFTLKVSFEMDLPITEESNEGMHKCPNCKQMVNANNLDLHLAFCQRNNFGCLQCGMVMRRSETEKHVHCEFCGLGMTTESLTRHSVLHERERCDCGELIEKQHIVRHKTRDCIKRFHYD